MSDKEFLMWIYDRLASKHGENPNSDYMIKLNNLIGSIEESPQNQTHKRV